MTRENEFPKPTATASPGPVRGPAANSSVAREMVAMHLSGRNPQRQQTSSAIHARVNSNLAANKKDGFEAPSGFLGGVPRPNADARAGAGAEKSAFPRTPAASSHVNSTYHPSRTVSRESGSSENSGNSPSSSRSSAQKDASTSTSSSRVCVPAKSHTGPCKNPQCADCGTVIIPSPKATYPLKEEPSITVNDWSIYTTKGPICSSDELDHLNDTRFDFPLPEMIFGANDVKLVNDKTGAVIDFNTLDALDSLAATADFKVAYYKEWLSTRPKAKASDDESSENSSAAENSSIGESGVVGDKNVESVSEPRLRTGQASEKAGTCESEPQGNSPDLQAVKPYDWTYSTNYRGTLTKCRFVKTMQDIPLEKLVRQDPILFFDESVLFEDELGDNGISMLSTKIRVMPSCLLLLCRFSMRVDDVAFRIRDTRIYIDLESNVVLREYKTQQASYAELLGKVGRSSDPKKLLRDSNWVSQNTPLVSREMEIMEGA